MVGIINNLKKSQSHVFTILSLQSYIYDVG